jgi:hypothetical protein
MVMNIALKNKLEWLKVDGETLARRIANKETQLFRLRYPWIRRLEVVGYIALIGSIIYVSYGLWVVSRPFPLL